MNRPRVGIFDFACCEGCQLQIVNLEEELLDLLRLVEPVEWREAMSDQSPSYDIAIVEGSITRPKDEERLLQIREQASVLIALGACATMGGVNKLRHTFDLGEARHCVYGEASSLPHLETGDVKALDEIVKVDAKIEGCPIEVSELAQAIKCLLAGRDISFPDYPVCVECKTRENCCRYDYGEICLGPITRAGCQARCPANGTWCFGCRGLVSEANLEGAKHSISQYGKKNEDLESKIMLFGTK